MSAMKLKCWNKILIATGVLCPFFFYSSLMILLWFADEGRWNAFGKYVLVPFAIAFLWCGDRNREGKNLCPMCIRKKRLRVMRSLFCDNTK